MSVRTQPTWDTRRPAQQKKGTRVTPTLSATLEPLHTCLILHTRIAVYVCMLMYSLQEAIAQAVADIRASRTCYCGHKRGHVFTKEEVKVRCLSGWFQAGMCYKTFGKAERGTIQAQVLLPALAMGPQGRSIMCWSVHYVQPDIANRPRQRALGPGRCHSRSVLVADLACRLSTQGNPTRKLGSAMIDFDIHALPVPASPFQAPMRQKADYLGLAGCQGLDLPSQSSSPQPTPEWEQQVVLQQQAASGHYVMDGIGERAGNRTASCGAWHGVESEWVCWAR